MSQETVNIYQCARCKVILGDSLALHPQVFDHDSIVLEYAGNVKCPKSQSTKESISIESERLEYEILLCSICDKVIGKRFVKSSVNESDYMGKYSLSLAAIFTYKVGSNLPRAHQKRKSTDASEPVSNKKPSAVPIDLETVDKEVEKIQHVLLNVLDRLAALEERSASVMRPIE